MQRCPNGQMTRVPGDTCKRSTIRIQARLEGNRSQIYIYIYIFFFFFLLLLLLDVAKRHAKSKASMEVNQCFLFFFVLFGCTRSQFGKWDLIPWSGMEPRCPELGGQGLGRGISRGVPVFLFQLHFPPVCKMLSLRAWCSSLEARKAPDRKGSTRVRGPGFSEKVECV